MSFKKVIVYIASAIIICSASFFTGSITTKHRLVEQYRLDYELARERATVLTDTIDRARKEVGELGESINRQRTSVAELRELLTEVRTRYEKMEELLSGVGMYDTDSTGNNNINDTDEEQISD